MIELKEDGAVTVERLLRDDRLASRVLGQPLLQVKDHPIHDDHAPARVIVRDDVGPRVHADAVLELPKAFGAALLERAAAERARRGPQHSAIKMLRFYQQLFCPKTTTNV